MKNPTDRLLLITQKSGVKVYEYPDRFEFTLPASRGTTDTEWIDKIGRYRGSDTTPLRYKKFEPTKHMITTVVILKSSVFEGDKRTTENIRRFASDNGLKTPNTEIGPMLWEVFTPEEIKKMGMQWIAIMHESLTSEILGLRISCLYKENNLIFASCNGEPNREWQDSFGFAFTKSQTPAPTILFGFMPFPSVGGFTMPLYKTPDGVLVCHELNEAGTHVTGFDMERQYAGNPLHMMELPEQLRFPVSIGDPRMWILTFGKSPSLDRDVNLNGLFIGTVEQLLPYEEIMTTLFGSSRVAEIFGKK